MRLFMLQGGGRKRQATPRPSMPRNANSQCRSGLFPSQAGHALYVFRIAIALHSDFRGLAVDFLEFGR
jgi:hypothetical protein